MTLTRKTLEIAPVLCALLIGLSVGGCERSAPIGPDLVDINDADRVATAQLVKADGTAIAGTVRLTERDGKVEITALLEDLPPGQHGFHIHEGRECEQPTFSSAGGHFAPDDNAHGSPTGPEHHAGDLGNIDADREGVARARVVTNELTLADGEPNSAIGRAIIIHAGADDMESQPSGDAGDRLACGVIELTDEGA